MAEFFARVSGFFRDNPRMWIVLVAAIGFAFLAVWTIYGGFSLEIGRFFAFQDEQNEEVGVGESAGGSSLAPTANIAVSPTTTTSGSTVNVSWSSTNATSCTTTAGTFSTGGQPNGSATDTISASFTGTAQFRVRCFGPGGSVDSNIAYVTVTASGGGGGSGPVDPSGACVFKTNFNAPEGAWFCNALKCQLDGNPSGGQEYPPKGPASSLAISVYHRGVETPNPALGPIFVRYILDATPKCSSGGECYPPKDPLWTCTRPDGKEVDLGRDGSDYYDCYRPIIRVYDAVPVTCCANTGLSGDCYTIKETVPGSSVTPTTSPAISSSPSPSPALSITPSSPVQCAPLSQTVRVNQIARLEAAGGSGTYTWNIIQGGQLEEGGNTYIGVRYGTTGLKTLRVNSAGSSAACTVNVVSGEPTIEPAPSEGLSVVKSGRNITLGEPAEATSLEVYPGQIVQFSIRVTNNGLSSLANTVLRDELPPGMSYRSGTTQIDGRTVATNTVTTTGLMLGRLSPNQTMTVRWSAIADRTGTLAPGPNRFSPEARVSADGVVGATDEMPVTVYGYGIGSSSGAGTVPTGPGSTVVASLLAAAVFALLYGAYTRSDAYRRKEADEVSRDQGPLDFRG